MNKPLVEHNKISALTGTRVLQLIDSLEAGGAERVAINFANALVGEVEGSFLCATRAEGLLKSSINSDVGYLYINKTKTIDFKAIRRLHRFVKDHHITIIHAHSTSYFLATIIKVLKPKLKLVWHDHYGKSEFLEQRPKGVLKICSYFFNHVFSVNSKLETWAKQYLKAKSVSYLPNFAIKNKIASTTNLKGEPGKRIVCLANLRPQKDHLNLLQAFKDVLKTHPDWTLHLVGQDFKDAYSKSVFKFINTNQLEYNVFVYGSCPDTSAILSQCTIGVLSSKSEGLPLALLEYGLAGLPVITTDVGDCNLVVSNRQEGLLIPSNNSLALEKALLEFITNPEKAKLASSTLHHKVELQFSEASAIKTIKAIYQSILV
ncbi:glycosyltransferase involved in cell wall biosynthesis [Olleya aquimaris]|uniref:Glycosyltransferase involved in cell wall biosynthesis n=2 Tax=Olleya aquimaris TaxID=639310 RepID=A0A327RM80_9FLAO|nr:glycosyltransferase involved in cell wall biosynthesis [Olleya aquimaris]